jgi:hypothetical protein
MSCEPKTKDKNSLPIINRFGFITCETSVRKVFPNFYI